MIRLSATSQKLQAVLAGVVTTNQLHCVVCYSDQTSTSYNGSSQYTSTNSTTAVDICDAPAASTIRDIDFISIRNRDTAAATVTVMVDVSATDSELVKATLAVGDQLVYTHSGGWNVIESDGSIKSGSGSSLLTSDNTWTGHQTISGKLLKLDYSTDLASAATVDLGTATGNSVTITHSSGTTAITSFGGATLQKGTIVAVIPSISGGTLTVTHHATNMILLGGANITLASGDVLLMMKNHDSNAEWKHVGGWKANGTAWVAPPPSGTVVQRVEATPYTTYYSDASGSLPLDNTIPQKTEGAAYVTQSFTPLYSDSILVIEGLACVGGNGANTIGAFIVDTAINDALAATAVTVGGASYLAAQPVRAVVSAASTSARTYELRIGAVAGITFFVNGTTSARLFGGVMGCRLSITEIKA